MVFGMASLCNGRGGLPNPFTCITDYNLLFSEPFTNKDEIFFDFTPAFIRSSVLRAVAIF
jgi:hypothetical protein